MNSHTIETLGKALYQHLRAGTTMLPLTTQYPELTLADAYRISQVFLETRLRRDGEQVIGKKIGVTSPAVQEMFGVYQPDFGFLTDAMLVGATTRVAIGAALDTVVHTGSLIAPRAEAEIAFRMAAPLQGPGVTPEQVLAATEAVMPCFEIVDSRIRDWQIKIEDTVADNASCGVFVLGEGRSPQGIDLAALEAVVTKNGEPLSRGLSSSVQGAPQNAVAWLVNTLGEWGIPFEAGDLVLSGSLVPLEPVVADDSFQVTIEGLGHAEVLFV